MKNFILFVFFLFFLPGIYAQSDFPKNASEDKEKIMSDLYWEIWNDSVQACIDRYRRISKSERHN
jgi:endo-1,4-beta-xylanase